MAAIGVLVVFNCTAPGKLTIVEQKNTYPRIFGTRIGLEGLKKRTQICGVKKGVME